MSEKEKIVAINEEAKSVKEEMDNAEVVDNETVDSNEEVEEQLENVKPSVKDRIKGFYENHKSTIKAMAVGITVGVVAQIVDQTIKKHNADLNNEDFIEAKEGEDFEVSEPVENDTSTEDTNE